MLLGGWLAAIVLAPLGAAAQPATGTVSGSVTSANGAPVGAATIALEGTGQTARSDAAGHFTLVAVPAGDYAVVATKTGFAAARQEDVVVAPGATVTITIVLAPASFSSLAPRTIGNVSTRANGKLPLNTTPASINVVSAQTFEDQAQLQVTKVLTEIPGFISNPTAGSGQNGAAQGSQQTPQIRGALPYETESLIDGHPVSVGLNGYFSQTFLNPAVLQNVEVVKGPGSMPTEINYAIGGTVNYRTLEPTRDARGSVQLGVDGYGGLSTATRLTGSVFNHVLDYAFAYATNGTPGLLRNDPVAGSALPLAYGIPPYTVNGQQLAGYPIGFGAPPAGTAPYNGTIAQVQYQEPLYVCCSLINSDFLARNELAKLRFNFSEQTALTVSYLGAQGNYNLAGANLSSTAPLGRAGSAFTVFVPPAGYTGSVPSGTAIPFDLLASNTNYRDFNAQNLFQAEVRTALGGLSILGRYYVGASTDYQIQDNPAGPNAPLVFSGATWGGVPLCPTGTVFNGTTGCTQGGGVVVPPTTTYFNGQTVTFSTNGVINETLQQDHLRGESAELTQSIGSGSLALSYDRSQHDSYAYDNVPAFGFVQYALPPSSSQAFTTARLMANFPLGGNVASSLAYYYINYGSHYSGDGGVTWHDATHVFNTPRLGLTWRASADASVRLAVGGSIAPPYIALLSSPGSAPMPNVQGAATAFLQNSNNGQISPETAFGYDLGGDRRFGDVNVSADVYLTSLHNLFLPETFQNGTYTVPAGQAQAGTTLPLYVSLTGNLGVARYEGIELSAARAPLAGLGFRVQGSLLRAYTYNLSPSFYATAAGPYTTNLAIVSNVNFQPSGLGYNALEGGRVPYSQGYGELNFRTRRGLYAAVGATYYGPNNTYNEPAFATVSASVRVPLAPQTSLQIYGDNLTNAYSRSYYTYFGGNPVVLANNGISTTGYLGATPGLNYGPATIRFVLRQTFGR